MYARALIRSQFATALVFAIGFVLATVLFVVGLTLIPDEGYAVLGVPVSWLLLAFGVYPLLLTVSALAVRAANRNEARFRSLVAGEGAAEGYTAGGGDEGGEKS
ncbi:hypothetical protein GB864_14600 [Agromyces sp. MMS17-SY077]|uniref:DUF485 domain-containing protein n=1 Tax=Agromyces seonyuensis TaxID=2662446 RepID=A0A6I4P5P9_9MICO|nr:hypothetical protein [Agromyces seonyuensis]